MILKLGMNHQGKELSKVCLNHDPGLTSAYLTAMSTYVANAFELGKLLKCHLKGKTYRKWATRLKIQDPETSIGRGNQCVYK